MQLVPLLSVLLPLLFQLLFQLLPLLPMLLLLLLQLALQALRAQLRHSQLVLQFRNSSLQVLNFLAGPARSTRGVRQLLGEAGKRTRSRTYILSAVLLTGWVALREPLVLLRFSSKRATVGAEGLLVHLFSMSGCEV